MSQPNNPDDYGFSPENMNKDASQGPLKSLVLILVALLVVVIVVAAFMMWSKDHTTEPTPAETTTSVITETTTEAPTDGTPSGTEAEDFKKLEQQLRDEGTQLKDDLRETLRGLTGGSHEPAAGDGAEGTAVNDAIAGDPQAPCAVTVQAGDKTATGYDNSRRAAEVRAKLLVADARAEIISAECADR